MTSAPDMPHATQGRLTPRRRVLTYLLLWMKGECFTLMPSFLCITSQLLSLRKKKVEKENKNDRNEGSNTIFQHLSEHQVVFTVV